MQSPAPRPAPEPSVRPAAAAAAAAVAAPSPAGALEREPNARERSEPKELRSIDPSSLTPLVGRERELAMLADALLRKSVRPPLLVGEHGSGRSLLAKHLASVLARPLFCLEAPDYDDEEMLGEDLELIAEAQGFVVFDDLDRIASDLSLIHI